jgi:hypothetical protein
LHLFAKHAPTARADRQTGKDLNGAEHPRHDGDVTAQ